MEVATVFCAGPTLPAATIYTECIFSQTVMHRARLYIC